MYAEPQEDERKYEDENLLSGADGGRRRDERSYSDGPDLYVDAQITASERLMQVNDKYSLGFILYMLLLIMCLFVLLWEALKGEHNAWTLSVEVLINVALTVEVVIGIAVHGVKYFDKWLNCFDFVLTVGCIAIFMVQALKPRSSADSELTYLDSALLLSRYVVQLCRIVFFACKSCVEVKQKQQDPVLFAEFSDDDCSIGNVYFESSQQQALAACGIPDDGGGLP